MSSSTGDSQAEGVSGAASAPATVGSAPSTSSSLSGPGTADDDYMVCIFCVRNGTTQAISLAPEALLVHVQSGCGQRYCRSCVKRELFRRNSFLCLRCKVPATEDKLTTRTLEEIECEKDVGARRRVLTVMNQTRSAFPDTPAFLVYEEMREDTIYCLAHGVDAAVAQSRLEEHRSKYAREAALNAAHAREVAREETAAIRAEDDRRRQREGEFRSQLKQELQQKKEQVQLQNQLLLGEMTATASTGSVAASGAPAVPSAALLFLTQRPEPRELPSRTAQTIRNIDSQSVAQQAHTAGGYNYANFHKRNWTEIKSQLIG